MSKKREGRETRKKERESEQWRERNGKRRKEKPLFSISFSRSLNMVSEGEPPPPPPMAIYTRRDEGVGVHTPPPSATFLLSDFPTPPPKGGGVEKRKIRLSALFFCSLPPPLPLGEGIDRFPPLPIKRVEILKIKPDFLILYPLYG